MSISAAAASPSDCNGGGSLVVVGVKNLDGLSLPLSRRRLAKLEPLLRFTNLDIDDESSGTSRRRSCHLVELPQMAVDGGVRLFPIGRGCNRKQAIQWLRLDWKLLNERRKILCAPSGAGCLLSWSPSLPVVLYRCSCPSSLSTISPSCCQAKTTSAL